MEEKKNSKFRKIKEFNQTHKMLSNFGFCLLIVFWIVLTFLAWTMKPLEISAVERRKLAQFPEITKETILNGSFTKDFEEYSTDQFPFRNLFRSYKAMFNKYMLFQQDNNDLFYTNGKIFKMENGTNKSSLDHFTKSINNVYNKFLKGKNTKNYFALVPDKAYYLNDQHLKMDYDLIESTVQKEFDWAKHISIKEYMNLECYYDTDQHWSHEFLSIPATILGQEMGFKMPEEIDYRMQHIISPFYGTYYGQMALPVRPDEMVIMKTQWTDEAIVHDFESKEESNVYNLKEKSAAKDLYNIYLSGPKAFLEIEVPNAETDKELVVFRDSFASSLLPYMLRDYKKITVIDLRYINPQFLSKMIEFDDQDVLFIYSTLIINNSFSIK